MVNLLDLYPLTFDEFLSATDPALYHFYLNIQKEQPIEEIFHNRLLEVYNNYLTKTSHTLNGLRTLKIQYFS